MGMYLDLEIGRSRRCRGPISAEETAYMRLEALLKLPAKATAVALNLWSIGFTCPATMTLRVLSCLGAMAKAQFGCEKP
jgi:hypothetical protein